MATAVSTKGKYLLFKEGWVTPVVKAFLFTTTGSQVDSVDVTLSYNSTTNVLSPTADLVFDVEAETEDVAYVTLNHLVSSDPVLLYDTIYTKDLPSLYDFTTAGTLTIDSWDITFGGTHLLDAGKDLLVTVGLTTKITWAKLYTSADALLDTQNVTFTSSSGTGIMSPTADIVFNVASGTASYITLGFTDGTDVVCYKRTLSSTYTFATAGTLTVDTWSITI